jgi:hypothetical protein
MLRYLRQTYLQLRLLSSEKDVVWANPAERRRTIRMVMEVVVSLVVLGVCLHGLFSPNTNAEAKKYFSGFVGTVIGYWLH